MLKVNSNVNNQLNFKGALNNKTLLKGLGFISEHSASFSAGVAFASAIVLRPFVISKIPNTKKENKDYLSASSISSGLVKLGIVEAIALPIEGAIKKIDKNPKEFLKKETIDVFSKNADELAKSQDYKFATQVIKTGAGLLSAIPKSVFTVALLPIIVDKIAKLKKEGKPEKKENKISFKGLSEKIAKGIGGVLDNQKVQKFTQKHSYNSQNIARNTAIATDVLLASLYSQQVKKSKKIDDKKKNVLIANEVISTGACVVAGTGIDELVKKQSEGFVEKFKEANKNDPKILKYIEGINIIRPAIIFALIYYGALPFISGYFADKTDETNDKFFGLNKNSSSKY